MIARRLRAVDRTLELERRPWLMGVVNASPDSFSDGGRHRTLEERVALAHELLAGGADILDIGGESAITNHPVVSEEEETARVVPLIERVARETAAVISVDTYKPAVARAAVAAGAAIVNDVSGLRYPELAQVCADTGAALVVMHTRVAPKLRLHDPDHYGDVTADVIDFLSQRLAVAREAGIRDDQLVIDPGPDFAKTPAQTIEVLRQLPRLHELGAPLLLAVSRKDFIGALTNRPPAERLSGTLAAVAHGLDAGAHILRVHDVAAVRDFLTVRLALRGERPVERELALPGALRHQPHA
jgi:dihydropteroate synthase